MVIAPARHVAIIVACLALLWSVHCAAAQDTILSRAGDGRSRIVTTELEDVVFVGCTLTTPEQLVGVITSRPSELSITRRLARYFSENLRRNTATPSRVLSILGKVEQDLQDELRYFDPRIAEDDSAALIQHLQQNGFHSANVSFTFAKQPSNGKNTLTFVVNEGPRAEIDAVYYYGLEGLPPEAEADVQRVRTIGPGTSYADATVESEMKAILNALRRHGYYGADTVRAGIGLSSDRLRDTVAMLFDPGPRYRIARIDFVENSRRLPGVAGEDTVVYPSVNESARARQLEIAAGEWFDAEKVNKSRMNLISLGTFESVSIDTNGTGDLALDSALVLRVFTKNAKPYDVGLDFGFFQTSLDNFFNFGIGATAQHRNLLGGAQQATLSAQFVLQDIGRAIQGQQLETESLVRMDFGWPSAFRLFGLRSSLNGGLFYSQRRLVDPFRLESAGLNLRLPVALYQYTFFNAFEASLGLDRQVPRDYANAREQALANDTTEAGRIIIEQTFEQFVALDNYLRREGGFFTGIFLGGSFRGEHRDNPANPTSGTFSSISAEFGYGAGKFWRLQAFVFTYNTIDTRLVAATKVRAGHIFLVDPSNVYVPLERQFFAGGAASIRSFASRQLHDPASGRVEGDPADANLRNNILGSASLIELSFELRYTLPRPEGLSDLWASLIERSGFTFFTDIGNSFNRLTDTKYGTARLKDFIEGNVVAIGLGYRFDTPVGPFRVDYATSLYDPLRSTGRFMFGGRENIMGFRNWQLSIGLGHAF
ncbi:MAG: BamA/TamA family outer membrane protein [Candidatus Kapabacteria bacterium]|nr:BamA/TamA family outer membrane protein [Candidatus Kapabacteria bacterium]